MLKAAKAYLATQVSTASQGELLVMLYDTAIKHLRQAIEKMRANDMAGKGILISKAITIVSELQECLNKERGGEIAQNLFHLYLFCNTRLLTANLKVKPEMVEEVITILIGLRQAFAQILPNQGGAVSVTQPGLEAVSFEPQAQEAQSEPTAAPQTIPPAAAPEVAAAPDVAAAQDFAAALYVPVAPPVSTPPIVPVAAGANATPKTPVAPPQEAQAPTMPTEKQAQAAPGLRLRAANAYATTR
jgi:flagellar secretion chaperone FliS